MATSSATRSWCRPTCKIFLTPTTKLEQSGIRRKQRKSTTQQTWPQPRLSGKSTKCESWPLSPLRPLEATHAELLKGPVNSSRTNSRPKQTSFEQCTSVFSCARTRRQNSLSCVEVLASAVSITFFGCTGARSCKTNVLLTCMMRWGKGPWRGSSRDSRRTLRSKRHSAQVSLGLDTREHMTSRVQHTMEHSLQPNVSVISYIGVPLLLNTIITFRGGIRKGDILVADIE